MAIKKYFVTADTTISNAFDQSLLASNSATGSNMGAADILEVFQIYGQSSSSSGLSSELSRALIQFNTTKIGSDRTAGTIPASGSCSFHLKMYNAKHTSTLPTNFKMAVSAVSSSWQEGFGLDMVNYTDKTYGLTGSTWTVASSVQAAASSSMVVHTSTASNLAAKTFTLTNSTGSSLTFTIDATASFNAYASPIIGISGDSSAATFAQRLSSSITQGMSGSVTVGLAIATLTITQTTKGVEGNTTVATNITQDGSLITIGNFAGGSGNWDTEGGDYHAEPTFDVGFTNGYEDLEVDVSDIVEQWLAGTKTNYGFGIALSSSYEQETKSYYTKKFFARGTEFYNKRPILEVRWDNTTQDDRGTFFLSSSLASGEDNMNTVYLYNVIRGRLRNIPAIGTDSIYVSIYSGSADNTEASGTPLDMVVDGTHVSSSLPKVVTGSNVSTGVYKASFAFTGSSTLTKIYDVWFSGSNSLPSAEGATQFHTGTIEVNTLSADIYNPSSRYILSLSNLRESYGPTETARFKLYARPRDWSPTIYTKANSTPETTIITSASYEVYRASDGLRVIPFGTGSDYHTGLSYNVSGNYFDLDMSNLEKDQMYGMRIAFYDDAVGSWNTQPYEFKFKVRDDEY
tara:strand:+ start:2697 stop:4583 length:1887 start_codon:yes stop_codon:yes gene_type:complete